MRKTLMTASLIAAACTGLPGLSFAAPAKADDAPAQIKKALEERYPQVKVVDVKPAPIAGLYEVFTGDAIVYASPNGDYVMSGPLFDTRDKHNATAARLDERNSIDFASLPFDLAIKTVRGDGRRTIAVFADPDCPFCKELEHSIATFDNVTVYTFLYPLTSIHPDAANKAHAIWCSSDRSQTWTQWMTDGKAIEKASENCKEDPIDELHALGQKLRIGSTPTLFFANGQRVGSALTAEQLKQKFDAVERATTGAASKTSGQPASGAQAVSVPAGSTN